MGAISAVTKQLGKDILSSAFPDLYRVASKYRSIYNNATSSKSNPSVTTSQSTPKEATQNLANEVIESNQILGSMLQIQIEQNYLLAAILGELNQLGDANSPFPNFSRKPKEIAKKVEKGTKPVAKRIEEKPKVKNGYKFDEKLNKGKGGYRNEKTGRIASQEDATGVKKAPKVLEQSKPIEAVSKPTLTSKTTSAAIKGAGLWFMASALWEVWNQINALNSKDPSYKEKLTVIISQAVAQFGLAYVGAFIAASIAGSLTGGIGAIPGFLVGLAGGWVAQKVAGDSVDSIVESIVHWAMNEDEKTTSKPITNNKQSIINKLTETGKPNNIKSNDILFNAQNLIYFKAREMIINARSYDSKNDGSTPSATPGGNTQSVEPQGSTPTAKPGGDTGPSTDSGNTSSASGSDVEFLNSRQGGGPGFGGVHAEKLNPAFAAAAVKAIKDAEAASHGKIIITEGYRDSKLQAQYYANYVKRPIVWQGETYIPKLGPGNSGGIAAKPGQSKHQRGLAIDVSFQNRAALIKAAPKYGVQWYGPGDPPHFQFASGTPYVPVTGPAIVGELGAETIVGLDGKTRKTGSGPHIEQLKQGEAVIPAGDIVIPAEYKGWKPTKREEKYNAEYKEAMSSNPQIDYSQYGTPYPEPRNLGWDLDKNLDKNNIINSKGQKIDPNFHFDYNFLPKKRNVGDYWRDSKWIEDRRTKEQKFMAMPDLVYGKYYKNEDAANGITPQESVLNEEYFPSGSTAESENTNYGAKYENNPVAQGLTPIPKPMPQSSTPPPSNLRQVMKNNATTDKHDIKLPQWWNDENKKYDTDEHNDNKKSINGMNSLDWLGTLGGAN